MWYRNPRTGIFTAAVLALSLASLAPPALADYTVNYNVGGLSATALFSVVGGNLQVDLTSNTAVHSNGDLLTAVYFNIDGQAAAMQGLSAQVFYPSQILAAGTPYTGPFTSSGNPVDVSGEFAYQYAATGIKGVTGDNAIGSTGLNVFPSNYDWTNGTETDLSVPNPPGKEPIDGGDFSLVGDITNANNGLDGPVIQNSARFLFSGLPTGFTADAAHIPLVQFNFGTNFAPVPEPMYVQLGVLFGLATIGSGMRAWKGRRNRFAL